MAVINGTPSSETLNGTAGDDEITGGAGNDALNGGKGRDTAIYAGNSSDFRFSWSDDTLTITDLNTADGDTGTDSLQDIEHLQFADRLYTLQSGGEQLVSHVPTNGQISGGKLSTTATVHLQDGGWIVSWYGYNQDSKQDIYTQRYDSLGNAVGDAITVNTSTDNEQRSPVATALNDGGWLITWEGYGAGDTQGIFSQRFDQNGAKVGEELLVNSIAAGNQTSPCVTVLGDGGWLVSWESRTPDNRYSIIAQRYDASGNPLNSELTLATRDVQSPPNIQALPDGGWLTIWCNNTFGNEYGTYIQRFDSTGSPAGDLSHLAYLPLDPSPPSVTIQPNGGWTLLYEENSAATYYGVAIFAQNYDATGNPVGTASLIGSTPYGPNQVLALPDNNWLVAWDSGSILYFQRYDSTGQQIGDETPVNIERFNSSVDDFATTILPDGGWIFTWADGEDYAGDKTIYTQRYDKDGNRQRLEIQGTSNNDTLISSDGNIALAGGAGNDTYILGSPLDARAGSASWIHEAADGGIDTVLSYLHYYELAENIENGRILNTDYYAYLIGNSLDNTLYSNSNSHYLDGGAGTDTAVFSYATSGVVINLNDQYKFISIENATGSAYADTFYGNTGNNIFNGAAGTDTVNYATATSSINVSLALSTAQFTGGGGTDTLISIENLTGTDYNDKLTGNSANNWLLGGAGNDILNGGTGADLMIGGEGSDTFYVDNSGDAVNELAHSSGTDIVYSYLSQYTLGTNIENGRITASGTASMTGNSLNNILYAGAGNNVLNGGSGSDTVSYLYAGSAVTASLASTAAQATGGSGSDTLTAIENLTGSNYNDKLTGNSANNKLSGGLGNDVLNGGAGADNMIGGDGSDNYYVDHASDVVSETNADASTGGTDTIFSYLAGYNLGTNIENARILATGSANLTGNSLNNVLMAGNGNNVLNGGSGIDTASYAYAGSAVTINLSSTSAQATKGSGSDTLTSIENLTGSNYNDTLIGSSASNTLNGGSGNDRLTGGAGKDTLIGGAGNDIFAFSALADSGVASNSWDIIKDFVRGADKIDLSKLDANTAASGDNAFNKIIDGAAAFTAAGQLKVFNGVLYGNTDGDIDAEFAIQLIGVSSISLADFIA